MRIPIVSSTQKRYLVGGLADDGVVRLAPRWCVVNRAEQHAHPRTMDKGVPVHRLAAPINFGFPAQNRAV